MHAARPRSRGSRDGAPPCLPTVPVRRYWHLWLLACGFLATCLVAALVPATHAAASPAGGAAVVTSAGEPAAPGGPSLHLTAIAEADAEAATRVARPAALSRAPWPASHPARPATPRRIKPAPAAPGARAYRSPPGHAPPARHHG